jgi:hypothetical protein
VCVGAPSLLLPEMVASAAHELPSSWLMCTCVSLVRPAPKRSCDANNVVALSRTTLGDPTNDPLCSADHTTCSGARFSLWGFHSDSWRTLWWRCVRHCRRYGKIPIWAFALGYSNQR